MKKGDKKELKGSKARDQFKWLHKNCMPRGYYAVDSDLDLVTKLPVPAIVAKLDFKVKGDEISFVEVVAYNFYTKLPSPWTVPVYIVESDKPIGYGDIKLSDVRFTVYRYIDGDHRPDPPVVKLEKIADNLTWSEYVQWERSVRAERAKELEQLIAEN